MNDTLAVIACDALGCGCGDPKCLTVINAVIDGTQSAYGPPDGDLRESGDNDKTQA